MNRPATSTLTRENHQPGIPELTLRGMLLGALITVVFTSSNVYLGLKVGLTFSSSIPAAVISMAVLSFFARSNILENNMVQTQASAAGTLSSVIFVLPAILMIGYWNTFHFWQVMLICMAGGALGVIFSIPLRRAMVTNSFLPYPEGVAAAKILMAGHHKNESGNEGGNAKDILFGAIASSLIAFCSSGLHLLSDKLSLWFSSGRAVFQVPFGFSLALLSAGYLMGIAAGIAMLIGAVLAWGGFVPYLTSQITDAGGSISELAMQVWSTKVRFIGAGALGIAAVWTLLTLLKPTILGLRQSLKASKSSIAGELVDRKDQDMPIKSLVLILLALLLVLGATFHSFVSDAPFSAMIGWSLVLFGVLMILIIGFFIAAACGYMAGLVGSSSSPISGIGIIAIIIISLLLFFADSALGIFVSPECKRFAMALAIFITTGVVSVAAISNDNLQDLKTGYLVGATPKNQQIALLVGCVVGASIIAPTLGLLYEAYGFAGAPLPRSDMDPGGMLSAPQATLMMTITQGIFAQNLDWSMLLIGIGVGIAVIAGDQFLARLRFSIRISALAVGLGIYLPPSITSAIVIGSLLSFAVSRRRKSKGKDSEEDDIEHGNQGVLVASGFIVGESLMGVALAIAVLISISMGYGESPFSIDGLLSGAFGANAGMMVNILTVAVFAAVCTVFYKKST